MPPISIRNDNYYLGIWFCKWEEGNLLACAWRNEDGTYEGSYRFKDNYIATHAGMSWYTVRIPRDSDCDIADAFDYMFRLTSLKYFCNVVYTPINGFGRKAWEVFKSLPFTNVSDKEGIERSLGNYKSDDNWK